VTVVSTYAADNQIATAVRTAPLDPTQTTTYGEDANGNLTQSVGPSGTTTYGYDFEDRLTRVTLPVGTGVQFLYNADGLRVQKIGGGGVVTRYVLDDLQVMLEKDGTGATQVRYVPGLARIVAGAINYYLESSLGSVVALVDGMQAITDTLRYDAYGNVLQRQGTTGVSYQWLGEAGYYFNQEVGTYLLGLRHYSSTAGRFLTRDPIGFSGGVNPYEYVGNAPSTSRDPYGLQLPVPPPAVVANPVVAACCATFAAGVGVGYVIGTYTTGPLVEWWCRPVDPPPPGPPQRSRPICCYYTCNDGQRFEFTSTFGFCPASVADRNRICHSNGSTPGACPSQN